MRQACAACGKGHKVARNFAHQWEAIRSCMLVMHWRTDVQHFNFEMFWCLMILMLYQIDAEKEF